MFETLSQTLGAGQDTAMWFVGSTQNWVNFFVAAAVVEVLFLFLTSVFIPLGQIVSQEIDASHNRLAAYSWNLGSSLAGIVFFFLVSRIGLSPAFWFALILLGFAALQETWKRSLTIAALIIPSAFLLHDRATPDQYSVWTPYQLIEVQRHYFENGEWSATSLKVNHVGYQQIVNLSDDFLRQHPGLLTQPVDQSPYNVPFRFAEPNPRVLIVGAGTGNDVAAAVRNHSRSVDAVEIDPAILKIGLTHPEHPYQSPSVTSHLTDARAFMKRSNQQYDLILFGLLDSHTELSEYANMRIDNYVYTRESIQEARKLLSPSGVLFLKFQVNRGWVGLRLKELLTDVFGKSPVVFAANASYGAGATCFVISASDQVERRLSEDSGLSDFVGLQHRNFDGESPVPVTTDDWPYLYQKTRSIPVVFATLGVLIVLLFFYYRQNVSSSGLGASSFLFFFAAGVGFVLLETQAVSRLALFFGTTWQVNGIAIGAILSSLVVANIVVENTDIDRSRWGILAALLLSLLGLYFVPLTRIPASTVVVGWLTAGLFAVPVFFAGLLFSGIFRRTSSPSSALAANMLGAVVGGLAENLSLVIGLNALLLLAFLAYGLAGVGIRDLVEQAATISKFNRERPVTNSV